VPERGGPCLLLKLRQRGSFLGVGTKDVYPALAALVNPVHSNLARQSCRVACLWCGRDACMGPGREELQANP
jgi:hypothetical protein